MKSVFKLLTLSLLLLVVDLGFSKGIQLSKDGGYRVQVGISKDFDLGTTTVEELIEQIKSFLESFSTQLWIATEETFFIESVDILIPEPGIEGVWTYNASIPALTRETFASSDIRMTTDDAFPSVENPHPCGLPGKHVLLPYTFFDRNGGFGDPEKAMLPLWARYRWGVWEEHGYPSDDKFPYFYVGEEEDKWLENSCANLPLSGVYSKSNGNECWVEQESRPDPECRFRPTSLDNNATKSLMSFHWLESVKHFCREKDHDKLAPNRQNFLCNYQSVWEVIEQSPDFAAVSRPEPIEAVSLPTFRVIQHNKDASTRTPRALYILLDKGYIKAGGPENRIIIKMIPALAAKLIGPSDVELDENVFVTGASYPGTNGRATSVPLKWNQISDNRDEIHELIGDIRFDGEVNRDFGAAISEATRTVKDLDPINGAVIVVIKTGKGEASFFSSMAYEAEVGAALLKNNIKLVAIELSSEPENPDAHLKRLVELTSGPHVHFQYYDHKLFTDTETEKIVAAIKTEITGGTDLTASGAMIVSSYETNVHRDFVTPNQPYKVDLSRNSKVHVTFIHPSGNPDASVSMRINGDQEVSVEESQEWTVATRDVISYTHAKSDSGRELEVIFECETSSPNCSNAGMLFVTESDFETPPGTPLPELAKLHVELSTSTAEPAIDFGTINSSPYVVNAKVQLESKPVSNAIVTATARAEDETVEFELVDDGTGNPDALRYDGIYSAIFVPPKDGAYVISVTVTSNLASPSSGEEAGQSTFLLPVDQEFSCTGGRCAESLTQDVTFIGDLPMVSFSNVASYPGRGVPLRVTDFRVQRTDALNGVEFIFTSPKILGGGPGAKAMKYSVLGAPSLAHFLTDPPASAVIQDFTDTQDPDKQEAFQINTVNSNFLYFAVIAYGEDNKASPMSAIERIYKKLDVAEPGGGPGTDKPFFETAGGIVLIVVLVVLVVSGAAGAYWWYRKQNRSDDFVRTGV